MALSRAPGRLRPLRGRGPQPRASDAPLKRRALEGSFGNRVCPGSPPRRGFGGQPSEGSQRHLRLASPAGPVSRASNGFGRAALARPRHLAGLVRSASGPWRGTKPMEGSGVSAPATALETQRTRRRRKALKSAASHGLERSARAASVARACRGRPRFRPLDGWATALSGVGRATWPQAPGGHAAPSGIGRSSRASLRRRPSVAVCSPGHRFAGAAACVAEVEVRSRADRSFSVLGTMAGASEPAGWLSLRGRPAREAPRFPVRRDRLPHRLRPRR